MIASRKYLSGLALAAAVGALAAGCDSGIGLGSPFTGAKETLLGRPAPSPDLRENAKLVIPPPNAPLPVPGQGPSQWTAAAQAPAPAQQSTDAAPVKKDDSPGWLSGVFGSGGAQKTQ